MTRFLIEVEHDNNKQACDQAVHAFLATGSHFVTNADWGCGDDEHKAWFVADLESKDEALRLLPPLFRERAKVIQLQQFTVADLDRQRNQHAD